MISHKHSINANMKPYKICGNSANAYVPIQPILVKYKIQCVSWKVWKKGDDFNNELYLPNTVLPRAYKIYVEIQPTFIKI